MTNHDDTCPDAGSVDDVFRYLTRVVGMGDDAAVFELNQKLARGEGDLHLHWCRTDSSGKDEEGDVPSKAWGSMLRVCRDRNCDENRGPVDFATGRITAKNDGHAFVELLVAQDPGPTYDLTLSLRLVRELPWPKATASGLQPKRSGVFESLTARVQRVVLTLDALEEQGAVLTGVPKPRLAERVAKQSGVPVSVRTLGKAEAFRKQHPK